MAKGKNSVCQQKDPLLGPTVRRSCAVCVANGSLPDTADTAERTVWSPSAGTVPSMPSRHVLSHSIALLNTEYLVSEMDALCDLVRLEEPRGASSGRPEAVS